mmetsp:Transcript_26099/g.43111  ORF Transcript_26099/g.43111 Transcript_26099/m.43111 type:complete len:200 (+) Transcript_26099:199-798(+)|eukprot:CAMPEP_0119314480 /NCGR_PEP_ID=MMETSP1333-20130426/32878_1 /TAXON_ID=418940 /ORGANISM="Scyphosphaera apsteinii, Strain RCC1455" /LENGTH=199 /DNA_ID=CAMNT_0007319593 /DNA_START=196 /DNA_END=795 /DNA_ORIENTATION=+
MGAAWSRFQSYIRPKEEEPHLDPVVLLEPHNASVQVPAPAKTARAVGSSSKTKHLVERGSNLIFQMASSAKMKHMVSDVRVVEGAALNEGSGGWHAGMRPTAEVVNLAETMRSDLPVVLGVALPVAEGTLLTGAGNTLFHDAALEGDVEKIRKIFLETDGPFDSVNADGLTPFQCAVQAGNDEAADEIALVVSMLHAHG